jgi:hypothetical protein
VPPPATVKAQPACQQQASSRAAAAPRSGGGRSGQRLLYALLRRRLWLLLLTGRWTMLGHPRPWRPTWPHSLCCHARRQVCRVAQVTLFDPCCCLLFCLNAQSGTVPSSFWLLTKARQQHAQAHSLALLVLTTLLSPHHLV